MAIFCYKIPYVVITHAYNVYMKLSLESYRHFDGATTTFTFSVSIKSILFFKEMIQPYFPLDLDYIPFSIHGTPCALCVLLMSVICPVLL